MDAKHTRPRATPIVGKAVTVRRSDAEPSYFTDVHRRRVGTNGVVHAVMPAQPRDNPLVKVRFESDDQIVFFRLADLDVHGDGLPAQPERHGVRGSHLPERE